MLGFRSADEGVDCCARAPYPSPTADAAEDAMNALRVKDGNTCLLIRFSPRGEDNRNKMTLLAPYLTDTRQAPVCAASPPQEKSFRQELRQTRGKHLIRGILDRVFNAHEFVLSGFAVVQTKRRARIAIPRLADAAAVDEEALAAVELELRIVIQGVRAVGG